MSKRFRRYKEAHLNHLAFPLGGIGAGMICLEGTGALSHVSLRHAPDVFNEPTIFSALHVEGAKTARVLEGRVPPWKLFFPWQKTGNGCSGNGLSGKTYGLPRFSRCAFASQFPFARISLSDRNMPVTAEITGWSPFVPGDSDASSLPVAAVEYTFQNTTDKPAKCVFSFHSVNFMGLPDAPKEAPKPFVRPTENGFVLEQAAWEGKPAAAGAFSASVCGAKTAVDCAWFRGAWWDPFTMAWNAVASGKVIRNTPHPDGDPSRGASLYVPFTLKPQGSKTIRLLLAWYVPCSELTQGKPACTPAAGETCDCKPPTYQPWYAQRFQGVDGVIQFWQKEYDALRAATQAFTNCFYDTTLPPEAIEAAAANLSILKSPTCLRQADGRFWAWEGCGDSTGCCHGSCTHVWNYAQSMPHLFPSLERTLRETEFLVTQNDHGHQDFRAALPISPTSHSFHAAADGQLGSVIKVFRDWRISGNTTWMQTLWPAVRRSLEYCIATWDPDHTGLVMEPHHNTYDVEFWGPDGMCSSFYLAALQAAIQMGRACNDDVTLFSTLFAKGKHAVEHELWNGDYFYQKVQWQGLHAPDPTAFQTGVLVYSSEAKQLLKKEGPKYQYGTGCLADGVLGDWMARVSGLPSTLDVKKVEQHLLSVFEHNFKSDLSSHANPQRPGYAANDESGLLACTWPKGGRLSLPFPYSDEVWTGIEYQVAAHLIMCGRVKKGLKIVRAVRSRYDGRIRNPFDEYECGHWYARAMSSYSLLQALGGAHYDAVEKVLTLAPAVKGDYRAFLCTAKGYGTVGLRNGKPFVEVKKGAIPVRKIKVIPVAKSARKKS